MPECGIGLVPDVGPIYSFARAKLSGEYLGLTTERMGPSDAIMVGFPDYFIPQAKWPILTDELAKAVIKKCFKIFHSARR